MATQALPTTQLGKSKVNSPHDNEGKVESELISHSLTKIQVKTTEPPSTDQRREPIALTAHHLVRVRPRFAGLDGR
jgi:hypothetical protein